MVAFQFFLDEFENFLASNFGSSINLLFLGDFNIDILNNSSSGNELINLYDCHGIHPLINEPTRVTNSTCTIIDHIWTNIGLEFQSGVIKCDITDHFIIFTSFISSQKQNKIIKTFRDHSRNAVNNLKSNFLMYATDFCNCLNFNNLYNAISSFNNSLLNIYDETCPVSIKSLSVKPRK